MTSESSPKAIIIDDEQKARENLTYMLSKYCPSIFIVGEAWGSSSIKDLIFTQKPDIIFLDIQIGNKTIFDILDFDWVKNSSVIFTTAYTDYALDGYDFEASGYLLKPISKEKLITVCDRVINSQLNPKKSLQEVNKEKIVVNNADGKHILKINSVSHLIGQGNYTSFHQIDGNKLVVSKNLKTYEAILSDYNFFRISKSCLININHVTNFKKDDGGLVIMDDNSTFYVSRSHKKDLLVKLDELSVG